MPTNQDRESCSICGAAIEGVATVAPGVHELRPCGHPASHEHRTKAAEPLVPDGGRPVHEIAAEDGYEPGVTPYGDKVHLVAFDLEFSALVLGTDGATDKLLCGRVGCYTPTDAPEGGGQWCDLCLDRFIGYRLGLGDEPELVADGGRVLSHADVRGRSEAAQRSVRARLEQIRDDIDGLLESGDVGSIEGVVFGVADADLAEARATQRPGCEPPAPLLRILGEFVDGMAQTSGREPGFIAGYAVKMMEHSKASDDYNQTANTSRGDGE